MLDSGENTGFVIDGSGCLVHDQDGGLAEERPGQAQQLLLAHAQIVAVFEGEQTVRGGQSLLWTQKAGPRKEKRMWIFGFGSFFPNPFRRKDLLVFRKECCN